MPIILKQVDIFVGVAYIIEIEGFHSFAYYLERGVDVERLGESVGLLVLLTVGLEGLDQVGEVLFYFLTLSQLPHKELIHPLPNLPLLYLQLPMQLREHLPQHLHMRPIVQLKLLVICLHHLTALLDLVQYHS